jgi:hypothetical protein
LPGQPGTNRLGQFAGLGKNRSTRSVVSLSTSGPAVPLTIITFKVGCARLQRVSNWMPFIESIW